MYNVHAHTQNVSEITKYVPITYNKVYKYSKTKYVLNVIVCTQLQVGI